MSYSNNLTSERCIKRVILIMSSKGGVGKSTITYHLARTLALNELNIGVLDADIYSPSQPTLFKCQDEYMEADTDQHGKTTAFPVEKHNIKIASMGFVIQENNAVAVRGHRLSQIFDAFIDQIQ